MAWSPCLSGSPGEAPGGPEREHCLWRQLQVTRTESWTMVSAKSPSLVPPQQPGSIEGPQSTQGEAGGAEERGGLLWPGLIKLQV